MDITVGPVNRVFSNYKTQERIAELARKSPVVTRQGQREKVSISDEARTLLQLAQISSRSAAVYEAPPPPAEAAPAPVPHPEGPPAEDESPHAKSGEAGIAKSRKFR